MTGNKKPWCKQYGIVWTGLVIMVFLAAAPAAADSAGTVLSPSAGSGSLQVQVPDSAISNITPAATPALKAPLQPRADVTTAPVPRSRGYPIPVPVLAVTGILLLGAGGVLARDNWRRR